MNEQNIPVISNKLVSAKIVGRMLGLSKRTVFRLRSMNRLPQPVRLNGSVRWKVCDIDLFLQCNCDMDRFQALIKTSEQC